jgi:predicted dienelactone hydrolase
LGDSRVNAIVTFAPWNAYSMLQSGTAEIAVPVLTIGGDRDATVGTQYKTLHAKIETTPRALASYANAGHFSYTPLYCSFYSSNGCGSNYVDQDIFVEMMKTTVLSWLEYLRGREGAFEQLPEYSGELTWDIVQ